ncbi:acyl-CoA dehydrogenase family protein [Luedemannella helvata]|uniref:Acyl-CoA dehydrogenase family protein n=1 Tax=Luedemannella helvata TaxID=349315 RepID=A0ABP4VYL2_9ACTN
MTLPVHVRQAATRAAATARAYADEVDGAARFPAEAVAALRDERLLALLIPAELGGAGLDIPDAAEVCALLGRACGSTAMIFAMHQIQVACLVRHGLSQPAIREHLRLAAERQSLCASGTSERGADGIRASLAALEPDGDGFVRLRKEIGTISYAEAADTLLVTARRSAAAVASDQVLLLLDRVPTGAGERTDLTVTRPWHALGLRGTGSVGATVDARVAHSRVLGDDFAHVLSTTMLPASHVLWASVWLGIATDALDVAGRHLRRGARGPLPRGYVEHVTTLYELTAFCRQQAAAVSIRPGGDRDDVAGLREQVALNALKVRVSAGVVDLVVGAMTAIGLDAYLLDTPASLGRHLRDAMSAPLMIRNERLLDALGATLAVVKTLP